MDLRQIEVRPKRLVITGADHMKETVLRTAAVAVFLIFGGRVLASAKRGGNGLRSPVGTDGLKVHTTGHCSAFLRADRAERRRALILAPTVGSAELPLSIEPEIQVAPRRAPGPFPQLIGTCRDLGPPGRRGQ
jgi:hypothetical protein